MEEKVIPDYPTFAVTSSGLIRDLRTGSLQNGHGHNGYRGITLTNPSGTKHFLIHRLVASAFIDNPNNHLEVDHINKKPDDNRVDNLRWVDDFQQAANRGHFKNNTSGHKNITLEDKYFRVVIVKNKIMECRKRFSTLEEAIECRNNEYTRLNIPIP
jgi:hypothetical protein